MKLSIVMPVYNEKDTLREIVARVLRVETGLETELVAVDDFSTDGTRDILKEFTDPRVQVFYHEKNKGKGAALRTGFAKATGDIILVQDADLEYDPREYPQLLAPILDGRADVVYGSRFLSGPHRVLFFWHSVGNRLLTTMCNVLSNLNLTDMETCYKVFKREVLARITLESDRFGIEPELTIKVARLRARARIYEVPISYAGRDYSEGKKIGWKDGVSAVWHMLKFALFK